MRALFSHILVAHTVRVAFAFLMVVHALIHLMGFAKAFGLAQIAQLKQPISPPLGVLWLLAALGFLAGAILLFVEPRWWWAPAAAALVLSQAVILTDWSEARVGTVANLVVLVPVVVSLLRIARR